MIIKGLNLSEAEKAILNHKEIDFKQTEKGVKISADDFGYIIGSYLNFYDNPLLKAVGKPFYDAATDGQIKYAMNN